MISKEAVFKVLKGIIDPELGRDLVELNLIRDINIEDKHVSIKDDIGFPSLPVGELLGGTGERKCCPN
jgi:metal-sulfur cluster biosynthetic enzyme